MTDPCQIPENANISLYYAPGTRATRPRWLLEELEIPYHLVRFDLRSGEHKKASFQSINPVTKVPTLIHGQVVVTESLAICLHLADWFADKNLAPPVATAERAAYYRWMCFSIGTLEPAILEEVRQRKTEKEGGKYIPLPSAMVKFDVVADVLEPVLGRTPFLLGERFTTADIMVGSMMRWAGSLGLLENHPHIRKWTENLVSRPAYVRATSD